MKRPTDLALQFQMLPESAKEPAAGRIGTNTGQRDRSWLVVCRTERERQVDPIPRTPERSHSNNSHSRKQKKKLRQASRSWLSPAAKTKPRPAFHGSQRDISSRSNRLAVFCCRPKPRKSPAPSHQRQHQHCKRHVPTFCTRLPCLCLPLSILLSLPLPLRSVGRSVGR